MPLLSPRNIRLGALDTEAPPARQWLSLRDPLGRAAGPSRVAGLAQGLAQGGPAAHEARCLQAVITPKGLTAS